MKNRVLFATLAAMALSAPSCIEFAGGSRVRETPCLEVRALFFDGQTGWLGCAGSGGGGIWRTTNGGTTWAHASDVAGAPGSVRGQSSRFNDIEAGDDGSMYFCGGDNDTSPKIFVYRLTPGGEWEELVTRDTLLEGGGRGFSDCQNIAVDGDFIVIDDNAGSQIAWSRDGGSTWTKADVGQVSEVAIVGGVPYASGGTTGDGPRFYAPSDETLLSPTTLGEGTGRLQEARGMATPDGGRTWLLVGAVDGPGGAFVWRSSDGGQTWEDTGVEAPDVSFFEDVECLDDWCLAVGRGYPEDTGIAYQSEDAGRTWSLRRRIGTDVSPFYTASAGDGAIWVAGDGLDLLRLTR